MSRDEASAATRRLGCAAGALRPTRRRAIAWLACGVVLLPALWFAAGWWALGVDARATAQALAWAGEHLPDEQRNEFIATVASRAEQWREIVAADGSHNHVTGGEVNVQRATLLYLEAEVPLAGLDGRVARVRQGLGGLLRSTAAVGLIGLMAALLTWSLGLRQRVDTLDSADGRLRDLLTHDPLTGLLNREGLRAQLKRGLQAHRGRRKTTGLLLIDLDRFRVINESFGQRSGDQLLRAVASRLESLLRPGMAGARIGADQFALQVDGVGSTQAVAVMGRNVLRALEPAYDVRGREAVATFSIGIALADVHADTVDQLINHALAAMRTAKSSGGDRLCLFEPSMLTHSRRQLEMDMRLRRALQAGEFQLLFQPIVEGDARRIHAVEALLRWNDVVRGQVSPGEFIPILEQTGLIVPVGDWVMREACRRASGWRVEGATDLTLSVNVSPLQFADADFVRRVQAALESTGFPADRLQLEVTEGLLLDPTAESLAKMDALVDLGVRLAVDDFGMGYSSMAYLKRFRLHTLKIDRMFVVQVMSQARDAAIVRAIVELGHAFDMHVTAEGVETEEQHQRLTELGCDSMQGFLYARPMPYDEMRSMIRRQLPARAEDDTDAALEDWSTTMAAQL